MDEETKAFSKPYGPPTFYPFGYLRPFPEGPTPSWPEEMLASAEDASLDLRSDCAHGPPESPGHLSRTDVLGLDLPSNGIINSMFMVRWGYFRHVAILRRKMELCQRRSAVTVYSW